MSNERILAPFASSQNVAYLSEMLSTNTPSGPLGDDEKRSKRTKPNHLLDFPRAFSAIIK
jgi:hypothetical protein